MKKTKAYSRARMRSRAAERPSRSGGNAAEIPGRRVGCIGAQESDVLVHV